MYMLPRNSRVFVKLQPASRWDWQEHFLNRVDFWLETLVWQNSTPSKPGEKARHAAQRPTLFRPEWMPKSDDNDIKKDTVAAPVDEIKHILSLPRG